MAIQASITENTGVVHGSAYVKVGALQIFPDDNEAHVWLDYYHDARNAPLTSGNADGKTSATPFRRRVGVPIKDIPATPAVEERINAEGDVVVAAVAAVPASNDFSDFFTTAKLNTSGANPLKNAYSAAKRLQTDISAGTDV